MSAPTDELKEKIRQLESDEAFLELSKKYNALNLFVKEGNTFFVSKTRSFLASTEISFSVITRF